MVQIQKARSALRAGRLDEAWGILTEAELRDLRAGQELREAIVEPLLDRAEEHLASGRARDALADVERAQEAGGNRPRTAEVRERALSFLRNDRHDDMRERAALESVRRHLRDGDASAARQGLGKIPQGASVRSKLERDVGRLEETTERARGEVRDRLEHGEIVAALEVASRSLLATAPSAATRTVLLEAARAAELATAEALTAGRIGRAEEIARVLAPLRAAGFGEGSWEEALRECRQAASAQNDGRWDEARVATGKLQGLLPGAAWVRDCDEALRRIEDGVLALRSSPLAHARAPEHSPRDLGMTLSVGELSPAAAAPEQAQRAPARDGAARDAGVPGGSCRRAVLWVDGVGSYLVLPQDRVTIGRAGSSAHPDVALAADIEGVHAEIVRAGEDYFVVARGKVRVGGQEIEKHLLADGDELVLGRRTKVRFRLPTNLSPTALLELGSGLRAGGDVRRVVLLERHLILGSGPGAHVRLRDSAGTIVLGRDGESFRVKASEPVVIDGRAGGVEEIVPLGAGVEVGCVSFTITADSQGDRGA